VLCIHDGWGKGVRAVSKIEIGFRIPVDNTFTNLMLYEGILYILTHSSTQLSNNSLAISEEDLKEVFRNLERERVDRVRLQLAGNDIMPRKGNPSVVQKFLQQLNIPNDKETKITGYGSLLKLINSHADYLSIASGPIPLSLSIDRKDKAVYIGNVKSRGEGVSFQLFKTERYTGITSTEYVTPSEHLTTYLSKEMVLLALLGIYSSFITRVSENRNTYYFFLFFPSDEIGEILSLNKRADEMLLIKDEVRGVLEEVLSRSFSEELLTTEVLVNLRVQELLSTYTAVNEVSLLLVKLAQERQTYKIYELIPFTVNRRRNAESLRPLSKLLKPDGVILERLRRRDNVEYSSLVSAIMGLYRFVVLGDAQGLAVMIREIHNAYHKVKTDEKLRKVTRRYENIIRELDHVTALL